jgi:ATP-dependent helicase/nuclease subunit A
MTEPWPVDQEQRQQAIDPALSVHVEAPAGSGKTTVLLKRYLSLLAQVDEPEEIVALTFTRKAAGELRARIQHELNKRAAPRDTELPQHEAEMQELALAAGRRHVDMGIALLERLQINTFHGFCAHLLRLIPHEAGLPPNFGLLEEQEATRFQKEAVELTRRRLRALPADDQVRRALVRRLVRLNNDWPRLAKELKGLLARRDILGDFITLARESRDPAAYEAVLREHLNTMILPQVAHLNREFSQAEVGRRWPEVYRYLAGNGAGVAATLPDAVPRAGLDDLPAWRALAQGILTSQGECYKSFRSPKFPQGISASPWGRLLQNLPEQLVQHLQPFCKLPVCLFQEDEVPAVQDLIILLSQVLSTYQELCHTRGALDFTALEEMTLKLLSGDDLPELFLSLDRRLSHLLVDEFQDTSVNQMTLLCRLLAGWEGDGRRTLMVVGDPKQSIYGWRQARLELFFQSRDNQRLPCPEAPPFTTLALSTNFRASRALIQWANAVFGQSIMADRDVCGVEFRAAAAAPGAEAGEIPYLALFPGQDRQTNRSLEAAWLAHELSLLQKKMAPGETVGVLLFVRTHLPIYLAACRRAGLSLKVRDGLPLTDSLSAHYLHTLAMALVRPHDDVAWAGVLRGLAGPLPLSLLAELAGAPGDFWSEKISAYAAAAACTPRVKNFVLRLEEAGRRVGREPLPDLLSAWLAEVDGWRQLADWEGPLGVANARAYLDLLAGATASTPEETLIRAGDLLVQAYQPPDPRAQDSPVEVLTVHAAKGLEFDYVLVPHLDWEPLRTGKNDAPFLMEEVPGAGTAVIALNRPYAQTEQSVLYYTLGETAKQRSLAEARRLFYVAVTRARKRLQMTGLIKENKAGEFKPAGNSPLGWLWQHYPEVELYPDVVNLWQEPPLAVSLTDELPELSAQPMEPESLPPAYDIPSEPWPYEIRFPSQLAAETPRAGIELVDRAVDAGARLRGEISHRLLETLSLGGNLPEPEAVAPALLAVAGSATGALKLAQDILAEIRACQTDPFLARLLAPTLPVAKSEWGLEAWHAPDTLYRGQIDRLVFDGQEWWLLDYKTARPAAGVDWEIFIQQETEKYRPQLLAYREMAAKLFDVTPPEIINIVLYFTANRRHVRL